MNQADRDRLVALKKAKDGKMTQRQAAEELKISERQVRRLSVRLGKAGDKAVLHGLRGRSNRRIDEKQQNKAVEILKRDVYKGFGPTLAAEYLAKKYGIEVSKETARKWMKTAGLWRARQQRVTEVHQWRERRERFGDTARASRSKRCRTSGREPNSCAKTLTATERPRRVSRAKYTSPMPPAPRGARIS
jgi:transposase